jgi:hypothetical protein
MVTAKITAELKQLGRILKKQNYPANEEFKQHLLCKLENDIGNDRLGILISVLKNF